MAGMVVLAQQRYSGLPICCLYGLALHILSAKVAGPSAQPIYGTGYIINYIVRVGAGTELTISILLQLYHVPLA